MKKKKMRPSVTKALMWRITALALALWLCMMCGITWMCARDVYDDYLNWFEATVSRISDWEVCSRAEIQDYVRSISVPLHTSTNFPFMNMFIEDRYEYAAVCFDKLDEELNGVTPCLVENGSVMFVDYFTTPETIVQYTAYIDLDETQFGRDLVKETRRKGIYSYGDYYLREDIYNEDSFRFDRLTGWFEGNQFHLVEVADYPEDVSLSVKPKEEWITVVDTVEPEQELVHIYLYSPYAIRIKLAATRPVTVDWVTYDNLGDMLENGVLGHRSSIFNAVFSDSVYFTDASGGEYLLCLAAQASPLKVAFSRLLVFYVATLLILAVILFLIYRGIRKKLVTPMKYSLTLMTENPKYVLEPEDCWWEEAYELYVKPRDAIHELKKEVTQLNTALDYAWDAEENRRLMVSNITHELKTPLAVIHSYAEGLKEGIAADKQEHYLDVILEEAQRMDGMVLEMLDLSRLEAGKVRLATDRFSLLELTQRVVDKMKLLVEEKELSIEYVWAHDCEITADEGRITQAVTNLVSNAIKYSPRGGTLHLGVTREKNQTLFSIENESEPLSEEVLAKIWDSFYRTDKSRTEKGTGLGLPITKAIIELHGGTCHVSNTKTGVEFKFYLP